MVADFLFMILLFDDGSVWSLGHPESMQLGMELVEPVNQPQRISELKHEEVIDIACSSLHVLALTRSNNVYSWGVGNYGILGNGSQKRSLKPYLIKGLRSETFQSVHCTHSASFLLSTSGTLYTWGTCLTHFTAVSNLFRISKKYDRYVASLQQLESFKKEEGSSFFDSLINRIQNAFLRVNAISVVIGYPLNIPMSKVTIGVISRFTWSNLVPMFKRLESKIAATQNYADCKFRQIAGPNEISKLCIVSKNHFYFVKHDGTCISLQTGQLFIEPTFMDGVDNYKFVQMKKMTDYSIAIGCWDGILRGIRDRR
eukprot:TRINITY_DN2623_c0_g1_i1.p1 TRINITY_DN2623_c0_g1~~TRINITY_DN2623_c0_g1_i1.p1  ORF type:complete len:347 (-),score=39.43 TRINITY_DN2623_c0_g1_i1:67-1005(-)